MEEYHLNFYFKDTYGKNKEFVVIILNKLRKFLMNPICEIDYIDVCETPRIEFGKEPKFNETLRQIIINTQHQIKTLIFPKKLMKCFDQVVEVYELEIKFKERDTGTELIQLSIEEGSIFDIKISTLLEEDIRDFLNYLNSTNEFKNEICLN